MSVLNRNNVHIKGSGDTSIVFAHGFGCDQNMWRYVSPPFEDSYKTITYDHVGAGQSDLNSYQKDKYSTLDGYANDLIEIGKELELKNAIFVGHSVASMMGIIASQKAPGLFQKLILVAPSPYYINDGDYNGGFTGEQIEELMQSLESNHLGWSMAMAPVVMGNPDRKELSEELANSFCKTDPEIAQQFARTTFQSDSRGILKSTDIPALILQCSDDVIAPVSVGKFVHEQMPGSTLVILNATGHCPNLSAPAETITAIKEYLNHV